MLSNICRAVLRSLDHCRASADFSRRLPLGPAHSLEPLEGRALCSAAALPVVSIAALHPHASQSGTPAIFVVTRTGPRKAGDAPRCRWCPAWRRLADVDYQALPGTITIPKGKSKARITLTPLSGADPDEGARSLDLEILPSDTYTTAPLKLSAAATIASDAILPWVSITAATNLLPGPSIITEGVRPGLMDIRLSTNLATNPVTVGFTVSGTAPGSRYTLEEMMVLDDGTQALEPLDNDTVTFQPSETNIVVFIVAPDDGIAEDMVVTLTLGGANGAATSSRPATATLKIQDLNAKAIVDTKKWPIVPVKAPAGSTATTVDPFPLNVTIINKGTTPRASTSRSLQWTPPTLTTPTTRTSLAPCTSSGWTPRIIPPTGSSPARKKPKHSRKRTCPA